MTNTALDFELIFNTLPGCYIILQPDVPRFTILATNDAYARATFTQQSDIIGLSIFEVFTDPTGNAGSDGTKNLGASLRYVVQYKAAHKIDVQRFDTFHPQKGRYEERYWCLSSHPVTDEQDRITYIIHSVKDVTDQVKLEQREKWANEQYEYQRMVQYNLFMQAPVAIAVLTGDGHGIELANKTMLEIWGKSADILNRPLLEGLPELEGQGFDELLQEIKTTRVPYSATAREITLYRKGKMEKVYFNFVYQPLRELNGSIERVIVIATDVTEQVTARKAIELSEQRLNLAIESAQIGIWDMDLLLHTSVRSLKHDQIFGYENGLPTWTLGDFFRHMLEEDKAIATKCFEEAYETGKLQMELRIISKNGSLRWISVFGKVFFNVMQQPQQMLGTISDITRQKSIENAWKNSAEEMERRVQERTFDLQEANFNLERSNKNLEEFVYAASHDLQEPLRKIITFTEILLAKEKGNITGTGLQTFERIVNAAQRMQELIKDLFELSKASGFDEAFVEADLDELLSQVKEDLSQQILRSGAVIRSDKLFSARVIPRQVQQLFQNLISNSLKFIREGVPPVITITRTLITADASCFKGATPGSAYLKLVFSDNGIGFSQVYDEKIFQLFQRLHGKSEYPGTGIGLAICKKIAENHKGAIIASGEEGTGASFSVYLRLN